MKDFNIPVYLKAKELLRMTENITGLIDEKDDTFHVCRILMENAMLILAKIAGAEGGNIYSIRIDNATIIKLAAREMLVRTNSLRDICDEKYINLYRKEIEEFRLEFLEWVKTFDSSNDMRDEWDFRHLLI